MKRPRASARPRKTTRRWHLPPPLVHGSEPLEGGAVLESLRGGAAVLLWQVLRDVRLWVEATPEARPALFPPRAAPRRAELMEAVGPDAELVEPLRELQQLLAEPEAVQEPAIATACRRIAVWAEGRGALDVALAFAQNAALTAPDDAATALAVGRLAARLADHARAEIWFRRALGLARRAQQWRVYSHAFTGLGNLYLSRGNLPGAQRFHLRALRGARRGGLRAEQARALHDLFGVALEMGRWDDAERLARQAVDAYGRRTPRLAALAHDIAYFWMQRGHFERALEVFQAVLPLTDHPLERLYVEADLLRAAAGAGRDDLAHALVGTVRAKCRRPAFAPAAPRALLELARGMQQLGEWDTAREAAEEALRLATLRKEGKTRFMAESLLQSIHSSRSAAHARRTEPVASNGGEVLAQQIIQTLRGLSATSPHA